jgi:hypothetical protein
MTPKHIIEPVSTFESKRESSSLIKSVVGEYLIRITKSKLEKKASSVMVSQPSIPTLIQQNITLQLDGSPAFKSRPKLNESLSSFQIGV